MWHWMAFQSTLATASWLTWPLVVANAPVSWLRLWMPLVLPVRPPRAR
jgi:hypothetical protein